MKTLERRVRALETAAGAVEDNSFCGQMTRMLARGEKVPRIIVEPGETVEEVREREGIPDGMACIARAIVEPGGRTLH